MGKGEGGGVQRRSRTDKHNITILLVGPVRAVGHTVTLPRLLYARSVCARELRLLTLPVAYVRRVGGLAGGRREGRRGREGTLFIRVVLVHFSLTFLLVCFSL